MATDVRSVSAGARSGSGLTTIAVFILIFAVAASLAAPWIAPEGSLDPARLDLRDALRPPFWMAGGSLRNPLGSDDQGRDVVSTILYGSRISLAIGAASVALAATLGTGLGLWSGYRGGLAATLVMRMADVQLAIPGVLMALLLDGFARSALPPARRDELSMVVLVVAIGLAAWPQYARLARAAAAVECRKEHILAARLLHLSSCRIILRHILPNVLGPLLVVGTVGLGIAVGTEATLSFLGVGLPPTEPSLGTLIRTGSDLLLSGEWWVALCPAAVVVLIMLALNVVGDWLRDAIDQRAG